MRISRKKIRRDRIRTIRPADGGIVEVSKKAQKRQLHWCVISRVESHAVRRSCRPVGGGHEAHRYAGGVVEDNTGKDMKCN